MQQILPLIPHGATVISENLCVERRTDKWTYSYGGVAVFSHSADDTCSFRMISSSFLCEGICRNVDIEKTFNVSKSSVIRNKKKYEKEGSAAFYRKKKSGGGGKVLTADKIKKAEELLSEGYTRREAGREIGVKYCTLSKAVSQGRIREPEHRLPAVSKSQRNRADLKAADQIGYACTRSSERILAAFGLLNTAEARFERCDDVSKGGVLAALPALTANGLYHRIDEYFPEFSGYYSRVQIVTLLGFMALCRIKSPEKIRWEDCGEWGKLFGLDRIPEVRCLREKMRLLSQDGAPEMWGEALSRKWVEENPDLAGVLYVDGHVRTYGGKEKIPKKYVTRERLCLRGFMDYWINDVSGQPFFFVRKTVNRGMLKTLREDIVPRLLKDVPGQPAEDELRADPYLHRFIIVFDREGYSPVFFREMWEEYRIACISYHKYQGDDWDENEFSETETKLGNGEITSMKLAERGSYIGQKNKGLWVREIRKLTASGRQTSIVSTAYRLERSLIAVFMFARWCQEVFFKYMREHFHIDLLADYMKEELPDTARVISGEWRKTGKQKNSINGKLTRRKSRFGDLTLNPVDENDEKYFRWKKKKTELAEEIALLEKELIRIKEKQKNTDKYIPISELPEDEYFRQPYHGTKNLVDTVKMIAYRAETSMAAVIMKECGTFEQARALVRDVFLSEADLIPDRENQTLNVRVHSLSAKAMNRKLDVLLTYLNNAQMKYPGTNLLLHYTRIEKSEKGVMFTSYG